ncbi:PREDICTED: LOW QUALITY PROTEIN: probable protein phosphatase 2C 42, partial [Theobroma cacao]|uniref:LOW QUALITY PROTEIN: probable protein phosphatase 2C 42 n=1 Tax=Theobroma cacao TaxID=3641 RepID=A0AB32W611_THECC
YLVQVSRSIGDVYMKHARYDRELINGKFRLPEPMNKPILSANPTIISHVLQPNDAFLILASDGLWEHLSNEKAVDIVHNHPRAGSAERLVMVALQEAARKREMKYSGLWKIGKKVRRHFHDDITVIVLFFNHDLISRGAVQDPLVSNRNALEHR